MEYGTPQKERLGHIDFLYAAGIIMVVLGHSLAPQWHDLAHPAHNNLERWIYSFHMPLFFFLSGFVNLLAPQTRFIEFVRKRALRLLLPFVFVNLLYIIPKLAFARYTINEMPAAPLDWISFLWLPYKSHNIILWFLPVLFLVNCAMYPLRSSRWRYWNILATAGLAALHIWNPFGAIEVFAVRMVGYFAIYYWLGCLACEYRNEISGFLLRFRLLTPILLLVHAALVALNIQTDGIPLLTAVAGIALAYAIACEPWTARMAPLAGTLARATFTIYLLSGFGHSAARVLLLQIAHLNVHLVAAGMFACGLAVPLLAALLVRRLWPPAGALIGLAR